MRSLEPTDTFCTEDKTAPYRQVSDVLPDLVDKFAEGSHVGGAEQLKKRALRHALDSKAIPLERGASGSANYGDWSVRAKLQTPPQKSLRQPTVTPSSIGNGAVKARTGSFVLADVLATLLCCCRLQW